MAVDLKNPDGVVCVLKMVEHADALIDPFRPGVTERLGIGPDVCLARNPRLVYGRMTGWGQDGPLAHAAGHDINYISLAGALAHFGAPGRAAHSAAQHDRRLRRRRACSSRSASCAGSSRRASSGKGQVIDAAMVDGAAVLMSAIWGFAASGIWQEEPGVNMLDTGAAYYDTYATKDGKWISFGAIEDQFFAEFLQRVGFDPADFPNRTEREAWPGSTSGFTELFLTKTRDEWCEMLEGTDVCFAPVLPMSEAKLPSAHRGERDDRRRERV